ncbi:hypothetical protein OCGS_2192 [Oceaniovalibus guishaninsula JLT2003]|uniref:Mobilization relaxase n=1 Tax=Oceaniovalibus guishaninsula JLT2003 TaxID=1231392 RepID=K2HAM2_9RHOB|nr:relaxase/mobilization nuclease domain-containing protein [Oceaniovalibus guishaninsula]EKE43707.1 hypothetical protein OCGS_2192 [Oceaniovalibus guishaninsula JLT2003]
MLIKFMGGRGGGGPIAAYLVARDRPGREEAPPDVVRGDIAQTRELIDSLDRKWTYTTGVISFAREDAPSEAQQRAVMDDFERVAFAGMDPEQYDITWVRHSHTAGGRVELHFLTPRMELRTGKALNIAPPGWERTYAPLRDAWNHAEGWARPDDPDRARTVQFDRQMPERAQTREAVAAFLEGRILAGEIEDRAGIVRALEEAGFTVPRQGKDYITAADPDTEARFRLKGRIFERDWTRKTELDRAAAREDARGTAADRGVDLERAATARRELEQIVESRARRHREGYEHPAGRGAEPADRHRERTAALAALDRADLHRDRGSALRLAVAGDELGAVRSEDGADRTGLRPERAGAAERRGEGRDVPDRPGRAGVSRRAPRLTRGNLQRFALYRTTEGVKRDGQPDDIRARALGRVRELGRQLRGLGESLGRYGREAVEGVRTFLGADRDAETNASRAERSLGNLDRSVGRAGEANDHLDWASERLGTRTRELVQEKERIAELKRQEALDREQVARDRSRGYGR